LKKKIILLLRIKTDIGKGFKGGIELKIYCNKWYHENCLSAASQYCGERDFRTMGSNQP